MLYPVQAALVRLELAALPNDSDGFPMQTGRAVLANALGISDLITKGPLGPDGVILAANAAGDRTRERTDTLRTASKFATATLGFFALVVIL